MFYEKTDLSIFENCFADWHILRENHSEAARPFWTHFLMYDMHGILDLS